MGGRPAVFLDRDGTVIEDLDYLSEPERVRVLPGAAEAIARLNRAGLPVVVVTNQSGIGRGYYSDADYRAVQKRTEEHLARVGGKLTGVYHCPHAPDQLPPCECRKPMPGLFLRAARDHDLDLTRSYYVGDRLRDVEPGLAFGGLAFLIGRGGIAPAEALPEVRAGTQPTLPIEVEDLAQAVDLILRDRVASAGTEVGSGSD